MTETLYQEFLKAPLLDTEREELTNQEQNPAFNSELAFGTGGMRQIVASGTNRLNRYNIYRINQALGINLENRDSNQKNNKIIIGYDSRLTSREFARISYHTLRAAGYDVKVFEEPIPTPIVSFAIRETNAIAGIILTASHNPTEYNGYKLYNETGGQIVSPVDKEMQALYKSISYDRVPKIIHQWVTKEINNEDVIRDEILESYLNKLSNESFVNLKEKNISILYSPLHGAGGHAFNRSFDYFGFTKFSLLDNEAQPDGNFPLARSLNPEDQLAFQNLIDHSKANNNKYELLFTSDPDADRLGCVVYHQEEYQFLNGNQIGALLADFLISQSKLKKGDFICKTIVTSDLQKNIASHYKIDLIETLTGFKFIGAEIEKNHSGYIFGGEESYGYLPIPWVRDKDSISSAMALAHLAEKYKKDGKTLIDAINDLYLKYGYYSERLINLNLAEKGPEFLGQVLESLKKPETTIAAIGDEIIENRIVKDILNLQENSIRPISDEFIQLQKTLPAAVVVQLSLKSKGSDQTLGKITIRPSGTEPKVKIYLSLTSEESFTNENHNQIKNNVEQELDQIDQYIRTKF